jgi:hypothetical protein
MNLKKLKALRFKNITFYPIQHLAPDSKLLYQAYKCFSISELTSAGCN